MDSQREIDTCYAIDTWFHWYYMYAFTGITILRVRFLLGNSWNSRSHGREIFKRQYLNEWHLHLWKPIWKGTWTGGIYFYRRRSERRWIRTQSDNKSHRAMKVSAGKEKGDRTRLKYRFLWYIFVLLDMSCHHTQGMETFRLQKCFVHSI